MDRHNKKTKSGIKLQKSDNDGNGFDVGHSIKKNNKYKT